MKKKTSTKKSTNNTSELDLQTPPDSVDVAPESAMQVQHAEPLTVFEVLQRRMEREAK